MALPSRLRLTPQPPAPHALPALLRMAPMTATCTADRHGTLTAYWQDGCRCPATRALAGRRQKQYRAGVRRRVPGIGVQRRLMALGALGHTQRDIAAALNCNQREVSQLVAGRPTVGAVKAQRIAALYEQLRSTTGPSTVTAKRARTAGWLGPDWWDDDTIDAPRYDPVLEHDITRTELDAQEAAHRLLEVHRLTQAGHSAKDIARRIGTHSRTVVRYRAQQSEAS